jgi:hypothetical protein
MSERKLAAVERVLASLDRNIEAFEAAAACAAHDEGALHAIRAKLDGYLACRAEFEEAKRRVCADPKTTSVDEIVARCSRLFAGDRSTRGARKVAAIDTLLSVVHRKGARNAGKDRRVHEFCAAAIVRLLAERAAVVADPSRDTSGLIAALRDVAVGAGLLPSVPSRRE